jgi:hypothetical protein
VLRTVLFPRYLKPDGSAAQGSRMVECSGPTGKPAGLSEVSHCHLTATDGPLERAGRRISAMGDKSPKKETAKPPKKGIKERRRDKQAKQAAKGTASP